MSHITITLSSIVANDPETRHLPNGTAITKFSMPANNRRKKEETTTWWNCSAFGKVGETIATYCKKGSSICVTGEPDIRTYVTKDGETKVSCDITVSSFGFNPGTKQQDESRPEPRWESRPAPKQESVDFDDDIPF